jgi:hypothetical protein
MLLLVAVLNLGLMLLLGPGGGGPVELLSGSAFSALTWGYNWEWDGWCAGGSYGVNKSCFWIL